MISTRSIKRFTLLATWALVPLVMLITLAAHGNAQQVDQHALNYAQSRKSFVKLTVESPILEKGAIEGGSGVLISYQGHILTAAHVIDAAVDEDSIGHQVFPRSEARIVAQFLNALDQLDTTGYEATVLYYSSEWDVALLKIELPSEAAAIRYVPALDPPSAHLDCADCFAVLGYTSRGFEMVSASPGQAVLGNYKRMFTSNMTSGYSGGPVFHKSRSEWRLVGIAVSGDKVRQATNFIVTIQAADQALGPIRDQLEYIERLAFPSQRFKDWAGISFTSQDDAELKAFVEQKLKANTRKFVEMVLSEDFYSVLGNKRLANTAKLLLEHSLEVMFNQQSTVDPILFTLLVDRLVTLYKQLGVRESLSVARWREDVLVQLASCDRLSKGTDSEMLYRCWQRLDGKQYQLIRRIKRIYGEAFSRFVQQPRNASPLVQWSETQLVQLMEWGDFLSKVGARSSVNVLRQALMIFRPVYLEPTWVPSGDNESPRIAFRAAAADKFDQGRIVLVVSDRQRLKALFKEIGKFRKRVCAGVMREIAALRSLSVGHHPDSMRLDRKLVTEIRPYCS